MALTTTIMIMIARWVGWTLVGIVASSALEQSSSATDGSPPSCAWSEPLSTWPTTSDLSIGVKDTVPWPQRWCRCRYCALVGQDGARVELFDPWGILPLPMDPTPIVLSSSKWHGFFHTVSEEVNGTVVPNPFSPNRCDRVISQPVFIVPILTWHVGHLLVDILEPLYYTIKTLYDSTDPLLANALLYMEVAQQDERNALPSLLDTTVNDPNHSTDTPFRLLRLFTRHSVRTKDHLISQPGTTCFTSGLHLGLDVAPTYYIHGADHHPAPWDSQSPSLISHMWHRYQGFRDFLWAGLGLPLNGNSTSTATVIRRSGTRKLTNQADMLIALRQHYHHVDEVKMESISFSDQLRVLQSTSVLISQYGTAAHNVVFLKPGSTLALLMQPGWCDWHWVYTDQARLLGIHVLVYCHPLQTDVLMRKRLEGEERYRWHQRFWRQGPWYSKDMDYEVHIPTLVQGLDRLHHLSSTSTPAFLMVTAPTSSIPIITIPPPPTSTTPPPICAHLTLDTIVPMGTQGFKVRIVPEVIVPTGGLDPFHGLVEGRFLLCVRIFVVATDDNPEESEETCYSEGEFNEFSTVDVVVPQGEYVVHAWVQTRHTSNNGDQRHISDIPSSECFLAISTSREQPLDFATFAESDMLDLELSLDGQSRTLSVRLGWPTALAWDIAQACRDFHLIASSCALIARAVYREAWARQDQGLLPALPAPQSKPSPSWPFIFYHLEKSGGSTLRLHIVKASLKNEVSFFLPCYDEKGVFDETFISCHKWAIKEHLTHEKRSKLAVVAGHFQWNVRDELPSASTRPSCFTILRDPVERAISFYYERAYPFYQRAINDFTPQELESLIREFYGSAWSKYRDEGMSNAACKLFCDAHTHHGLDPYAPPPAPKPVNLTLARQRLATCVVGIQEFKAVPRTLPCFATWLFEQEDWENTKRVIWHWFPWLEFADTSRHNVGNVTAERSGNLRPELRQVLLDYNQCDSALYEHARVLFRRQLAVLPIV